MAKKHLEIFNDILLNENAYIYTRQTNSFFSKRAIEQVFKMAKDDKSDQAGKALHQTFCHQGVVDQREYKFSGLVLKYITEPTFLAESVEGWWEQKLGYLFIADFKDFVFITKKNISGIQQFMNNLETLDYNIITKLFLGDGTTLEKLSMDNLNFSNKAMRSRSVESDDLAQSFNYSGANTYMLSALRVNNDSERYAIAINTSKIGKAGVKNNITFFLAWAAGLINQINHFQNSETFLDVFAKPYDYETEKSNLLPISVTILFNRLIEDLLKGFVTHAKYFYDGRTRDISLSDHINGLSRFISLVPDVEHTDHYKADQAAQCDIFQTIGIKLLDRSIRLRSDKLRNIKIYRDNESLGSLIDYFNNKSSFLINFDQCDFIYGTRKLFRDSKLLGSIDYLLEIFDPDPLALNIVTEKGTLQAQSVSFQNDSTFYYVEWRF